MRAVIGEVPESWLAERARLGHDLFDEMWEGVLHMVPPPGYVPQTIGSEILTFLGPLLAKDRIYVRYEMGVYRPGTGNKDYRIPDLVFFGAGSGIITDRGLEGGPLAVLEIRSPNDETYEKFDFWAQLGVGEIVVILPDTRLAEIYRLAGTKYVAVSADEQGRTHARTIDTRFSTTRNGEPRLRVEKSGTSVEI